MAGGAQGRGDVLRRGLGPAEEQAGQGDHPVGIGRAGLPAHRPAGARRDPDQILPPPRGRAFRKVEPEAQLIQQRQFP